MRIAVCDDEKREREQFLDALHAWDPAKQAECFSDGSSFLEAAGTLPPFDIVFLDIFLTCENGVNIARELQDISPETAIVFVTTSPEYAVDAFSLQALHYLIKPITKEGVMEAFRRLEEGLSVKRQTLTLTVGRENHSVYQDEICYLKSSNHAIEVFLTGDRCLKVWMTLGEMEQKLGENFLKLNRGTVVNMEYIEVMGTDSCILRDGTKLEMTRRERMGIRAAYDNYLFSCLSRKNSFQSEVE